VNVLVLTPRSIEHRRPDVQGHATRCDSQVCRWWKLNRKKDLAMEPVSYGSIYVAQVALGANDSHVAKAFEEAEAYQGPSSSSPMQAASLTAMI